MYQNGRRVKGYQRKKLHKIKLKNHYVRMPNNWTLLTSIDGTRFLCMLDKYWRYPSLTPQKKASKTFSSSKERTATRSQIARILTGDEL